MKGILLISHGEMAKGLMHSASLFFGVEIEQSDYLCLYEGDGAEEFGEKIKNELEKLDTGDGVIILADLYGGTPCNQAIRYLRDQIDVIAGMNLGILVQLLSDRLYGTVQISELVEAGKNSIVDIQDMLKKQNSNGFDEW